MAGPVASAAQLLQRRKAYTQKRLRSFRKCCKQFLPEGRSVLGNHTCIYAVGSAGRGELGRYSDIDLFVARVGRPSSHVDQVLIQAAILRAMRAEGFPDPSKDGSFLAMHTGEAFTANFGKPADDFHNTFTARMLLLLESTPVSGVSAYARLLREVVRCIGATPLATKATTCRSSWLTTSFGTGVSFCSTTRPKMFPECRRTRIGGCEATN